MKFLFISLLITMAATWGINLFQSNLEDFMLGQISAPLSEAQLIKIEKSKKPKLELEVKSGLAVKINKNGKKISLFKKNPDEVLAIASLTKLMTALIVLENPQDYDVEKKFAVSKKAALQDDVPVFGNLKWGERKNAKELLELMLVYSSNDAAYTLAEVMGLENFLEKMNLKAREMGLNNTYFINPTGLDNDKEKTFNYSTAKDLILLTEYILKNQPLIFEIFYKGGEFLPQNGVSEITVPEGFVLWGGKTGYTDQAGGCMVLVLFNREGEAFINIILGSVSPESRIIEMQKMINWLTKL